MPASSFRPLSLTTEESTRTAHLRDRARRCVIGTVSRELAGLAAVRSRPVLADPHVLVDGPSADVTALRDRARRVTASLIDAAQRDLEHTRARVAALSPQATLERGYAVVQTATGEVVRIAPVRDGPSTVEQPDFREREGAEAEAHDPRASFVSLRQCGSHADRHGASVERPRRNHDDVGRRDVVGERVEAGQHQRRDRERRPARRRPDRDDLDLRPARLVGIRPPDPQRGRDLEQAPAVGDDDHDLLAHNERR